MHNYLRYIVLCILLYACVPLFSNARLRKIDSLETMLAADTLNPAQRVSVINSLVPKYRYRGPEAEYYLNLADSITQAENLYLQRGKNFFNRTLNLNYKKQFDSTYLSTIAMIDSMAQLAPGIHDLGIDFHWAYSNYYVGLKKYSEAEPHVEKAIALAYKLDIKDRLARLYSQLAFQQRMQDKYYLAVDNYLKALDFKDYNRTCYVYTNLAKIYRNIEDYENQLHYAQKGKEAAKKESINSVYISCLLDIATANYRMGKLELAEQQLLEAIPEIEKSTVKVRILIAYEFLARIYYDQKEYQKLESIATKLDDHEDELYHGVYYGLLGQSYLDRGQTSKALKYCTRGFKACDTYTIYPIFSVESCNCLLQVYEEVGDYQNALLFSSRARTLDSLLNKKEKFVNATKALNKKDLKNQEQLLSMQQNQKDQVAKMKLFRTRLLSGFIVFLSLFGLLSYFQLKKRNRKIAQQNLLIKSSLEEKDTLLKEIHHRVKNNLQIISSLLSMQMRHVKDNSTKQVLSEGKNRIRSIALIHQSLYQNNNINQLSIEDYIKEMISNLFATYKIEEENVTLDLEIENINLDVETMISLGLILNELLTNCLKHAFENNQNGRIYIQLNEIADQLILVVQDNGKGVDEIDFSKNSSFGNKLLKAFSNKLKADFTVENNEGTIVTMKINNYQKTA